MKVNFLINICLGIITSCFCSCSKNSENVKETTTNKTKFLYFKKERINVERKEHEAVTVTLEYTGAPLKNDIQVDYKISFPNQNAAIEGNDFELSANSGTINIPAGRSSVKMVLLTSVFENKNVADNRSIFFKLLPTNGFTLGDPSNNSIGASTEVIIISDSDDRIRDKKFSVVKGGNIFKIPYYANVASLDDKNTNITRAVIALHGQNRNADIYYKRMLTAAQMESSQLDTLLIVSPQFITESDINTYALDNEHLYWSSGGWKVGFLSRNEDQNPRSDRISSFSMMDSLMVRLEGNYPNLKTIILSGHSAGGQFVNRYAATTPIYQDLNEGGINVRFIVNNPSSYVYMDNKRIVEGTSTFEVPTTTCTKYNEYKYGLNDLPNYLRTIGSKKIKEQFPKRKVVYLVGAQDNNPNSSSLDTSCEALLQGNQRLERGMIYYAYLKDFYGDIIENTQTMKIVHGAGHNSREMFQSELGRFYAFRK